MPSDDRPILCCYDGSPASRLALAAAADLMAPGAPVVVLTVWQPLSARLAETGGFGIYALDAEDDVDGQEADAAATAAREGASRAEQHGFTATARVEEAATGVWKTIVDVADELDARMIVCGTRGRASVINALLGSTSHAVLQHARRPVLISPEPRDDR